VVLVGMAEDVVPLAMYSSWSKLIRYSPDGMGRLSFA